MIKKALKSIRTRYVIRQVQQAGKALHQQLEREPTPAEIAQQCGIPEKTAQRIIDYFFKNRRTVELIAFVRMTEEATGKR